MKFLQKNNNSKILIQNLKYSNVSHRQTIRQILLEEQQGFCAYSEEFFKKTDTKTIEHFYPKTENSDKEDDYYNWYLVKDHANENKPKKIRDYLPILNPLSSEIKNKLKYLKGTFRYEENELEIETLNFIKFLNLNRYELVKDRQKHLKRVQKIKDLSQNDDEFFNLLKEDNFYLSYISILEHELSLNLESYIKANE